jgi:tetratricopeptide (TPR) repeat protein
MNIGSIPTEAVSIYNFALELSNKGDFFNALTEYQKAIDRFPNFIEAYNNMGEIYSQMGNKDLAIAIYHDALKINRSSRVLLNLGVEHYNAKDFDLALNYFNESLAAHPDFLEGNFYTALVYYNKNNFNTAEKYFKNVLKADKKHLKTNYLLSYIYYEWKEYHKAIKCLDNIRDTADDISFINRYYGFCWYYLGNYDKAVSYLKTALESRPEYLKFKGYLESLSVENKLNEVGDINAAIRDLESKMMKEAPRLAEVTKLSMLYIFKGENSKAEKLLLEAKQKLAS